MERAVEFNHFLSSYYPDTNYGADRHYADMLEQAVAAERLGYASVSIPEHHLMNILMNPAPLQMAIKVAGATRRIKIITSVVQLPLHDMRTYAGEVVLAELFTDGRLILGVGRGAFAVEMDRMGAPIEESREKFDESLNVLQALLEQENVSWSGKYYNFDALTVMPRPVRLVQLMMAALSPPAIYHSTLRGFHIQTTPLMDSNEKMLEQIGAFYKAKDELGDAGKHLTISLSRVCWLAKDEADKRAKLELANDYYARFDNVFTGPGEIESGAIARLSRTCWRRHSWARRRRTSSSRSSRSLAIVSRCCLTPPRGEMAVGTSSAWLVSARTLPAVRRQKPGCRTWRKISRS